MRRIPPGHFNLTWHQRVIRPGPGRKQKMIGSEVYAYADLPHLLAHTQKLALAGFLISITPPTTTAEVA